MIRFRPKLLDTLPDYGRATFINDFSAVNKNHPVGNFPHKCHYMRYNEHRHYDAAQVLHDIENFAKNEPNGRH